MVERKCAWGGRCMIMIASWELYGVYLYLVNLEGLSMGWGIDDYLNAKCVIQSSFCWRIEVSLPFCAISWHLDNYSCNSSFWDSKYDHFVVYPEQHSLELNTLNHKTLNKVQIPLYPQPLKKHRQDCRKPRGDPSLCDAAVVAVQHAVFPWCIQIGDKKTHSHSYSFSWVVMKRRQSRDEDTMKVPRLCLHCRQIRAWMSIS